MGLSAKQAAELAEQTAALRGAKNQIKARDVVIDETFARQLSEYFDETFEEDSRAIDRLIESYQSDSQRLTQEIETIIDAASDFSDLNHATAMKEFLQSKMAVNNRYLAEKKKEPSRVIELETIGEVVASLEEVIEEARQKILERNQIVENLAQEKTKLKGQRHALELFRGRPFS